MFNTRRDVGCLLLAVLLPASACDGRVAATGSEVGTLAVTAAVSGAGVATVVVDVTAPDLAVPLAFNVPMIGDTATGAITIPAGSNRTLTFHAFDAGGVETHSGSVTIAVAPGANPNLSLVLQPLTGNGSVTVTLGSITVTVSPSVASLSAGDTARLTAALTDWNGVPTNGLVSWATHDPGIAVVSSSGLVTAVAAGTTTIVATYQGAAGTAQVTVSP